ncbi:MAG: hypothetical protein ABSB29_03770 [Nitrososphaerales archaeon]
MGKDETMRGMKDDEYQACLSSLGLLEGELIRLQYTCKKVDRAQGAFNNGQPIGLHKGLLVLTNDNMIFLQQEGWRSSNYGQALRIPLENISGVSGAGSSSLKVNVGTSGATEGHEFVGLENDSGKLAGHQVRAEIEGTLKEAREEKKRLAQQALSQGTVPAMVFCKFCGTKNKSDQPKCSSCGATLS